MSKRTIDRTAAAMLRKIGLSHKDVALLMNCSVDWSFRAVNGISADENVQRRLYELLFVDENSNLFEELVAASVEQSSK